MIEAACKWLKDNIVKKENSIAIQDRVFLNNPSDWKEVKEPISIPIAFHDTNGDYLKLGTLDALISFCKAYPDRKRHIVLYKNEATCYFDIDKDLPAEEYEQQLPFIGVPFTHPPETKNFGFIGFLDFIDEHADDIQGFETLSAAIRTFRTSDVKTLEVKERGPIITIESKASKDIEGAKKDIPKEIKITLPTGTREFRIQNTYLLRIMTSGNDLTFCLNKKTNDGSWEEFMSQAMKKLTDELPGVLILEGPNS